MDVLFELKLPRALGEGALLLLLNLLVAAAVHLEDALIVLSLLALLVALFFDLSDLGVTSDELVTDVDL